MYVNSDLLTFALQPVVLFYRLACLEDPHLAVLKFFDLFERVYSLIPANAETPWRVEKDPATNEDHYDCTEDHSSFLLRPAGHLNPEPQNTVDSSLTFGQARVLLTVMINLLVLLLFVPDAPDAATFTDSCQVSGT